MEDELEYLLEQIKKGIVISNSRELLEKLIIVNEKRNALLKERIEEDVKNATENFYIR